MAVTTTKTNKPLNPRGNDQSPKGYNRAELYSGKALDFDGVNDYANVVYSDTIGSVWSWVSIIEADALSGIQSLFGGRYNTDNALIILNDDKFNIYNSSGTNFDISYTLETGKKYHIALSQSGSSVSAFINGVLVDSISLSTTLDADGGSYYIGRNPYSAYEFFNGKISGVKLFNTALTAAQVADLYNNPEKIVPTGVADSNLKLWLPMQEGAGTTAYDGSGNGNHGTISGATYTHGIGAPVSQTAVIDWNKGTNRLLYSNKFDEATWLKLAGSLVSATRVDGPYNEQAWSVTYDGTSAGRIEQVVSGITSGVSYTCKVWARVTSGSVLVKLGGAAVETSHTLTTEWQLIDDVKTATSTTGYPRLRCDSAATIEAFGFSFRLTSEADLYIPTLSTAQTSDVLLPQGLTTGRDITGVNLFENVRKQGALNLDGNSWAEVHDNASLDITDAVSVECWVDWVSPSASKGILAKWGSSSALYAWLFQARSNSAIRLYIYDSTNYLVESSTLTEGWRHLCATYDGVTLRMYVDGQADTTTAHTGSIPSVQEPVKIGAYGAVTSTTYEHDIAQPRIYNRALTASEVLRNYNSGKNTYTND